MPGTNDYMSKTKEELIKMLEECMDKLEHNDSTSISTSNSAGIYDNLKESSSLQSHIEKIHLNSENVCLMMFRIYNLQNSDDIFHGKVSKRIMDDITKFLKLKIRNVDILIKYNLQSFVIIAPNTDVEGANKYAQKLNTLIVSNIFAGVSHLQSNFSTTKFLQKDDIKRVLGRLDNGLVGIENSSTQHFVEV